MSNSNNNFPINPLNTILLLNLNNMFKLQTLISNKVSKNQVSNNNIRTFNVGIQRRIKNIMNSITTLEQLKLYLKDTINRRVPKTPETPGASSGRPSFEFYTSNDGLMETYTPSSERLSLNIPRRPGTPQRP